jgi:hypothetical protein
MTYMADTLEQIVERIQDTLSYHWDEECVALVPEECDGQRPLCRRPRLLRDALSALQSLARERDALRANEAAIRSTYGWKRDGRELPDLVADLAARLSVQEPRQEGE